MYHHLGEYDYTGMISSRPFFSQRKSNSYYRYVVWYSEIVDHWVITQDFKLLDHRSADARAPDSGWFPWEVCSPWEVSDTESGWVADVALKIQYIEVDPEEARREREVEELAMAQARGETGGEDQEGSEEEDDEAASDEEPPSTEISTALD
jgi:hypothetical protein